MLTPLLVRGVWQGQANSYYQGGARFNLRAFWADHKSVLPLHFGAYVAEMGCKKAAAANVETVFSGAGKFTDEVQAASHHRSCLLPRASRCPPPAALAPPASRHPPRSHHPPIALLTWRSLITAAFHGATTTPPLLRVAPCQP